MPDLGGLLDAGAALLPPAGVAFIFWLAMRAILGADRRERAALARLEGERNAGRESGGRLPGEAPENPAKDV